jgi:hypothetical protein
MIRLSEEMFQDHEKIPGNELERENDSGLLR